MFYRIIALLLFSLSYTLNGFAANGVNQIGFGPKSVGMGSADLASIDDTAALQINPAALRNIKGTQLDIVVSSVTSFSSNHSDVFGNSVDNIVNGGSFITFGYVTDINEKLNWGFGLYVLGGSGVELNNINTAFGTVDDFSVLTSAVSLTSGFAYQVEKDLALGASLILTYANTDQQFFPETSSPAFAGLSISDADVLNLSYKLGLLYNIDSKTKLGLAYTSKKDLVFEGNSAIFNLTAVGLGKVTYSNVQLSAISLPQELGIGISHQLNQDWLIATEINWLNWSQSAKAATLLASNPDNAFAPAIIASSVPLEWKDQYVFALGASYHMGNRRHLLMGVNIANNPVPTQNISPSLAAVAKHHITLGYTKPWDENSSINIAAEYQLKTSTTYTNVNQPFGPNAAIDVDIFGLHVMFTQQW